MAQMDNFKLVNYVEERMAYLLAGERRFRVACAAMQGLLAAGAACSEEVLEDRREGEQVGGWVARQAVSYADYLLAELEVEP